MTIISVIIPVFNAEEYISDAVESVLNQTYKEFEIIIIDDGSTDKTLKRIDPYIKIDRNIRVIRQANSGPSKSRNRGIRDAVGRYCAFLDSDDIMMPDRLKLQVDLMEEKSDIGLVYTDLMTFNEKGIVYSSKKKFIHPYSGYVLDKLLIENFITTSTVMVRKSCFDNIGYFDERLNRSEDFKMWLNIAMRYKVGYIDLPLVKYRYNETSLSSDKRKISLSSYNVVKAFWEKNQEYKIGNKIIYRTSMAKHFMKLSNAYFYYGQYMEALKYVLKALVYSPFVKEPYKLILKILLNHNKRTSV